MIKYIVVLLSILITSSTVFSQTVTNTNYICIPTPVAKQIVVDLIDGDAAKEELILTKDLLKTTEKSSYMKDTLINNLTTKVQLCDKRIGLYELKEIEYIKYTNHIQNQLKKSRLTTKIAIVGLIVSIGMSYAFNLTH